eukprot:6728938-Ditylum_brightwellii.AAC.1
MSLQWVAQPGFEPGSSAHQNSGSAYLCGEPTELGFRSKLIIMRPDGSNDDNTMMLGWKIVTHNSKLLIECARSEFVQAALFLSKGYGLFSIKHITQQMQHPFEYNYDALEPDWDIIAKALDTLKSFNDMVNIYYLKGHQDNTVPCGGLDLPLRDKVTALVPHGVQHYLGFATS